MDILDGYFVSFTPAGTDISRFFAVEEHKIHDITVAVFDNDPYYTVHFVKNGKSIARQGMIEDIDVYIDDLMNMRKDKLMEKLGVL